MPASLSQDVGSTGAINASVAPLEAADKTLSWSSNSESLATENSGGMVMAVAQGSATITVTTNDGGFTDNCMLTVNTPVSVAPVQETLVKVYPKPLTDGWLYVSSNFIIEGIRIFDLSGNLMQQEQNGYSKSVKMNLDNLEKGMYIIQIEGKQSSVFDKVLIQ